MIANSWLITGPGTIAKEQRRRLRRLLRWHKLQRSGWVSKHDREQFCDLDDVGVFDEVLKSIFIPLAHERHKAEHAFVVEFERRAGIRR